MLANVKLVSINLNSKTPKGCSLHTFTMFIQTGCLSPRELGKHCKRTLVDPGGTSEHDVGVSSVLCGVHVRFIMCRKVQSSESSHHQHQPFAASHAHTSWPINAASSVTPLNVRTGSIQYTTPIHPS